MYAFLAIWGAVVSTVALTWNIIRDRHDRGRLKLDPMIGKIVPDHTDRDYVFVTVTNIGRRPVFVKGWGGLRTPDAKGRTGFRIQASQLPQMLKESEYVHLTANELDILGPEILEIQVWDSTGKTWKLSKRAFRRLQAEAKEIMGT